MKQINLLPYRIQDQSGQRRAMPFYVMATIVAVVAALIPWWMVRGQTNNLAAERIQREEAAKLAIKAATSQEQERQIESLIKRTQSMNLLARQEVNWQAVFNIVSASLPQDIRLSMYSFSLGSGTPTLKLTGTAPTSSSFAAFADFLKTRTEYSKVVVDGFTFDPTGGAVTFSVSLNVKTNLILYSTQ